MNLFRLLCAQMRWSNNTFGRGDRSSGVQKHLLLEIEEAEKSPQDIEEHADVIILALELALRRGFTPHQICQAVERKQAQNFKREWVVGELDQPCLHREEE